MPSLQPALSISPPSSDSSADSSAESSLVSSPVTPSASLFPAEHLLGSRERGDQDADADVDADPPASALDGLLKKEAVVEPRGVESESDEDEHVARAGTYHAVRYGAM